MNMSNSSFLRIFWIALTLGGLTTTVSAEERTFRIGFFEAGSYPAHADFRSIYRQQLQAMTPSGVKITFSADGFLSAEWNREKSKQMARDISASNNVDLIVAIGPWTVEDLLAAGFDKPIVAAFRFDPVAEGLLDADGRPIIDNLTVRVRPRKVESDLTYLAELIRPDTVGVLYFPSGKEAPRAIDSMRVIGKRLGFEIVSAEGYDTDGSFAYFKAYKQLSRSADAVYLLPLWGCEGDKTRSFFQMLERDRKPAFSSEGAYNVEHGAAVSGSAEPVLIEAHLQAWKTVRIIEGTVPADLPVAYSDNRGLTINGQVARSTGITVPSGRRYDLSIIDGPAADSVERMTVVDAVSVALTQNPGLQATYQTLEAAERNASKAWSAYLPQLDLNGSAAYYNDRLQARLSLRQELFSLGALKDIRTAALQRDQSKTDQQRSSLDLELAVSLAYLDLVEAEQMRMIEQTHSRQASECLQVARLRLELVETQAIDVWRAEQEWVYALQALRAAEGRCQIARILLNTLLGRPADYPFVADWQHFSDARFAAEESTLRRLNETPQRRESMVRLLDSLTAANNLELKTSDLEMAVRQSQLARTGAAFWPRLGFFADLGLTDELAERDGYDEANPSWTVGARISLPLFEGGRRLQERHQARALFDQAAYQKDQVSFEAQARVRTALEKALSRIEEFAPAARAAELAKQIYTEELIRYADGADRILDLVDASRGMCEAGRNALTSQIDYYRAVAETMRATGVSPYASGRSASEALIQQLSALYTKPNN
jgi:outer membrane protein TolC/ABC-type uncharacterized transport system substrate-binding protein